MPTHDSPAFEATRVIKSYATGSRVLEGLSLTVPRGRVLGLLGRNGSGKTTLLRCALGLLRPQYGEIRLLGERFVDAPPAHKARIAYVSQTGACPGWASLREMATINALLYPRWDDALLRKLASRFGIPTEFPLGRLSVGERQLALLALAFATRPELMLLDEPAAGLDPVSCRHLLGSVAEAIAELDGVSIIMSTHRLQDVERTADSVAVLREGKIIAHEDLDTLRGETRRIQILFATGAAPADFVVPGALRVTREGAVINAIVRLADFSALDALRAHPGVTVVEHPVGLEELFVEHYAEPVRRGH